MGNSCDKVKLYKDQDYNKLRSQCRKKKELFEDPEFQPSKALLPRESSWQRSEIEWLRPHQICHQLNKSLAEEEALKPELFVGNQDRFDINQGEIGDCWFLAPLSTLAENVHFMERVLPAGQSFDKGNYHGIFKFRFFRLGDWHQVLVDDRLPTRNGKLIYLRSNSPNEFWAPLLEKAYAKFYGSYAAIEGGVSIDAAVDFTGGIPQIVKINHNMDEEEKQSLFHLLELSSANGALITTSLGGPHSGEGQMKGLQVSHAYTVTRVVDITHWFSSDHKQLIRLRNPHGDGDEWRGDWSDSSHLWQSLPSRERDQMVADSDGEFYMAFTTDFLKFFGRIDIVHLNPMRMELNERKMTSRFRMFTVTGQWRRGESAGGTENFSANPQYRFSLRNKRDKFDKCSVVISLTQIMEHRKEEKSIGFRVYKLTEEQKRESPLGAKFIDNALNVVKTSGAYINLREVTEVMSLPVGDYCLVPSTFHSQEEGQFLVRLWVDSRWQSSLDSSTGRRIADHQCCFVCCSFGGNSCGCCKYLCRRFQACCGCGASNEDYYHKADQKMELK